jgi:hypothetical protein
MGESYHIIPGTTASSGISLTEDMALAIPSHSMNANHLGPYSQEGVWQIAGTHNSGEASGIFEVDLNGFVSGQMLGFTYANEFRTQSWDTISVTGASGAALPPIYTFDGIYQVYLPTGNYNFTINQSGYVAQSWSVWVSPGETSTGQDVELEQSNTPWQSVAVTSITSVTPVTSVTLPTNTSAQTVYPCKGSWNGTLGPGSGTISVLGMNQQITTNSIVTGTFDGDTTHGNWLGTVNTNYTVPGVNQKGQLSSTIAGSYTMKITNGTVTGTSTIPLTGQITGELKITFQGHESKTGQLTGTWTATLTITKVTYSGSTLNSNISAPGSGQFAGTVQKADPVSNVGVAALSALAASVYILKRVRQ